MKSVMVHDFSKVPQANIPRSVFNRSHAHKTSFDAGYLIPFYVDEALPGDSFNLKSTIFARMTTPLYPIMDNMFMDVHFFAVPLRLVWSDFQHFMGECDDPFDPDNITDYNTPLITAPVVTGWTVGSLSDYFGIPTGVASLQTVSFWHRAYNLIYNQWYKPQDICDNVVVDIDAGPDSASDYVLLRRAKRHDYFTSALPWPQKGPSVELPLGSTAPVFIDNALSTSQFVSIYDNDATPVKHLMFPEAGTNYIAAHATGDASAAYPLLADLTNASASTINVLRQAFQIQRLYERDARGGTRYTEIVRAHFGVVSPDARLQRPEYLGGSTARVTMSTVAQTSKSETNNPLGKLSAFGTITLQGAGFTKSFTEHCVVIGLLSVRADLTYQQGLPRMFSRRTRFDYYWPGLAHLGEQTILNKEIFCDGTSADEDPFGYQERWAEYRYFPSKITGQLRSTYSAPLDAWHLSQEFDTCPTLSPTFIEENPPMSRILAVSDVPHFIMDSFIDLKCARPMPVYSVPGLIDHF